MQIQGGYEESLLLYGWRGGNNSQQDEVIAALYGVLIDFGLFVDRNCGIPIFWAILKSLNSTSFIPLELFSGFQIIAEENG